MLKKQTRPVFIGGCERSGTTFLADIIGKLDNALVVPESQFIAEVLNRRAEFSSVGEVKNHLKTSFRFMVWGVDITSLEIEDELTCSLDNLRTLFSQVVYAYSQIVGATNFDVWIDHTPSNTWYSSSLLGLYPDARFIHLVRDGRAVCNSVLELDWGPNTAIEAATWWSSRLSSGFLSEVYLGNRCIRVYYEAVIEKTDSSIDQLLSFLNMTNHARDTQSGFIVPSYTSNQHKLVGAKPQTSRVDAWRREMSPTNIASFEKYTFDMLSMLGYEKVGLRIVGKSLLFEYCFIRPALFIKNVLRNKLRKSKII